ncbi:bacteriophage abortive infection AbiH family protein [Anaerorhabdus sp.]|uniref:bacteriophage abortive infection AbiH family protein n=1 Tax=Anaerorhabdus sp. TaxID=1872524 RepID=UPI002FCB531C
MDQLFIIGSGFDIDHGLKASYNDFHDYLKITYPNAEYESVNVTSYTIDNHGEFIVEKEEVVGYLVNVILRTVGQNWKDFENALGELDFENDFDNLPECLDRDGDENLWHDAYNNENLATDLTICVPKIKELFAEWVETIEITGCEPNRKFLNILEGANNYFLSFNYTMTLEDVYGIDKVCHVHGKQGGKIVVGHGIDSLIEENDIMNVGRESGLNQIRLALRKNTDKALDLHHKFFVNLPSEISSIYSYGFSFGAVDMVYIKELFRYVDTTNSTWYLNNFNKDDHSLHRKCIRKCGFKGRFSSFDS